MMYDVNEDKIFQLPCTNQLVIRLTYIADQFQGSHFFTHQSSNRKMREQHSAICVINNSASI